MRLPALFLVVFWGIAPQLGCFLPNEEMTESGKECCKHMAGGCGEGNIQSHACFVDFVQSEAAIPTPTRRCFISRSELVPMPQVFDNGADYGPGLGVVAFTQRDISPPPHEPYTSSLILRI